MPLFNPTPRPPPHCNGEGERIRQDKDYIQSVRYK